MSDLDKDYIFSRNLVKSWFRYSRNKHPESGYKKAMVKMRYKEKYEILTRDVIQKAAKSVEMEGIKDLTISIIFNNLDRNIRNAG